IHPYLTFDVVVFRRGSKERSCSIDGKGSDDGTPISIRSDVMLAIHKVTADCKVPQTFMDVHGTIANVWGICRTIGGPVSQNTREIPESCGICSLSKVDPYPSIGIFPKCQPVFLQLFPKLFKGPIPFVYHYLLPIYGNVVIEPLTNILIIPEHGSSLYVKFGSVGKDQWIL
ncbi:---NA---, partial [Paramuricea clavata]